MSGVARAANGLEDALKAMGKPTVYRDPSASVDPPAVVIGPPDLHWDYFDAAPNRAVFRLYVVTRADDQMLERLWDLVPAVAEAVAGYERAAVQPGPATAGVYTTGGTDLPAYTISVDVALEGD